MNKKLEFQKPNEQKINNVKALADIIIDLYKHNLDCNQDEIFTRISNVSDQFLTETMNYLIFGLLSNTNDIIIARKIGDALFQNIALPKEPENNSIN